MTEPAPEKPRGAAPTLESIFGRKGPLASRLAGYEPRDEQIRVARAVEDAMSDSRICLAEAGTGVGKSLAYLVPAVRAALKGKRTVISTHTINLQNQLMQKDIPLVLSLFPAAAAKSVPYALMKGRGNYLCRQALNDCRNDLFLLADKNFRAIQQWAGTESCTGDSADLPFAFNSWVELSSTTETCRGQDCPEFEACHYYKMRRDAAESKIIVVNHSLFLADLAVRMSETSAGVLPQYDNVVFDEAHHIEEVATKAFGMEFGSKRLGLLMDRIRHIPKLDLDKSRLDTIESLNASLFDTFHTADRAEFYLDEVMQGDKRGRLEDAAVQTTTAISVLANDLIALARADETLRERVEGMARLCTAAREDLDRLVFQTDDNAIRWGSTSNVVRFGRPDRRVALHVTPVSIAPLLKAALWDRIDSKRGGAILLSATFANSGGFAFQRSRLGIPDDAEECIVGSPFDYPRQAMLYVPAHLPNPGRDVSMTEPLADEIERIVKLTEGRAFLLFTSWSVLNGVHAILKQRLTFPLFKQGDQPAGKLVEEFRASGNGCLFGVQTFWEGVDVPGEALSCVIIDRIPFAVPDSPTTKARIQAIEANGGDSFRDFSIPQAQIRLKQGFGRLIRSRTDRGIVCILDTRLLSRQYGPEFVRYLPPAARASKWSRVEQFWSGQPAAEGTEEPADTEDPAGSAA